MGSNILTYPRGGTYTVGIFFHQVLSLKTDRQNTTSTHPIPPAEGSEHPAIVAPTFAAGGSRGAPHAGEGAEGERKS